MLVSKSFQGFGVSVFPCAKLPLLDLHQAGPKHTISVLQSFRVSPWTGGGEGIFQLQYLPEEVSRLSLQVPVLNYLLRLLDAVINRRHATLSCNLPKGTRTFLDLHQAGPKDTIPVYLCSVFPCFPLEDSLTPPCGPTSHLD